MPEECRRRIGTDKMPPPAPREPTTMPTNAPMRSASTIIGHFRIDVVRGSPREDETAGSMMSEAGLPAAISMPIARRAGVACS